MKDIRYESVKNYLTWAPDLGSTILYCVCAVRVGAIVVLAGDGRCVSSLRHPQSPQRIQPHCRASQERYVTAGTGTGSCRISVDSNL